MAAYKNFILTNKGANLLADLLNGNGELEFRYLSVGSGIYSDGEKGTDAIRGMEQLKYERQKIPFSSISRAEDGFVNLKAVITNEGIAEGYPMTEAGIFVGKKGEENEVLYCVSTTTPTDYMPDFSSGQIYTVIFRMVISIGDMENAAIIYKPDIYALAEDLQAENTRAVQAENQLRQEIEEENTRAEEKEAQLQKKIADIIEEGSNGYLPLSGGTMDTNCTVKFVEDVSYTGTKAGAIVLENTMDKVVTIIKGSGISVKGDILNGIIETDKLMIGTGKIISAYPLKRLKNTDRNSPTYEILDTYNFKNLITELGSVNFGGNVIIWTDAEGGNIKFIAPDGTEWEMDAYNGGFKLLTYANNIRVAFSVDKFGMVTFENGLSAGNISSRLTTPAATDGRTAIVDEAGFHIVNMPVQGYAGGVNWYNYGESMPKAAIGYYKQGDYYYFGTDYGNPDGKIVAGMLDIGGKAKIWADAEGGNIRIGSPGGTAWEMDAYNGGFRLFTYANGIQEAFRSDEYGVMTFGDINAECLYIGGWDFYEDLNSLHIYGRKGYALTIGEDNSVTLSGTLYTPTGTVQRSDRNGKEDIRPLDGNLAEAFIMGLDPVSYKFTDNTSGRTHYGLVAQDVEELMGSLGMGSKDFAGLVKSPVYEEYEAEEEAEVGKLIPNEDGKPVPQKVKETKKVTKQRKIPGKYSYGLRYEEFIPPAIKSVQILYRKYRAQQDEIGTLKKENQELEERLARLEEALGLAGNV